MSGRRGRRGGGSKNTTPSKAPSEPTTPLRSSRRIAGATPAASEDEPMQSSPALPAVAESSPPLASGSASDVNNLMSNNSPQPSSPLQYQTSPGAPGLTSEVGGMADDEDDMRSGTGDVVLR